MRHKSLTSLELKAGLDHERARSERLEGLLAEARRPWWQRWLG
jgi:hypothetical protein